MDKETQDWLFEENKEFYADQSARLDKVRDRAMALASPLSLLGGAMVYLGTKYPYGWHGPSSLWFYVPAGISLLLLILSVIFVLYGLTRGFKYRYVPLPETLTAYVNQLSDRADKTGGQAGAVLDKGKAYMLGQYAISASRNFRVNAHRSSVLLLAMQFAVASFVSLSFAMPMYLIDVVEHGTDATKVTITTPVKIEK